MTDEVREIGAATEPLPASPYVGLVPYREEDAPFFFGRDEERAIVVGNLRASRLTILYGASGVGKTSLLRAGAIPDLRERMVSQTSNGGHRAAFAVCRHSNWREEPLPALLEAIRTGAEQSLGGEVLRPADPGEPSVETLRRWTARVRTLLVVLDQFEDYFLYHPHEDGPGTFAEEFPRIVNEPNLRVNVLLSIREDAWAKLDRFEGRIPRLFGNYIRVEHLTRASGRDAIRHPVEEWNRRLVSGERDYEVEAALTEAVLDAAGGDGLALTDHDAGARDSVEAPFLQLVMERLWRATIDADDHQLTVARLQELGGAERIVESHLRVAVAALTPDERQLAGELFRFLVTRARTKIAHAPSDLAEWTGRSEPDVVAVCERLCRGEAGRILRAVPPPTPGEPTRYELFHDVLAQPVLDWRQAYEQHRAQRAARRRSARIVGVLAVLLAVFAVAFLVVLKARQDANAQRQKAESQAEAAAALALAETARAEVQTHLDVALLAGLEGYLARETGNTRSSLLSALEAAARTEGTRILHGHTDAVRSIALSPAQPLLASAGDESVRLWDLERGRSVARLPGTRGEMSAVAFSPDGRTIAAGGSDGALHMWNAARPTRPPENMQVDGVISSLAFSPDGGTVAVGLRRRVLLMNFSSSGVAEMRTPDPVAAVAFSVDGETLAIGGPATVAGGFTSGWVGLWDAHRAKARGSAARTASEVHSVAFSPDGATLAAGTDYGVRLSDARDLRAGFRRLDAADASGGVAFSPNGQQLATAGSGDEKLQLWNVRSEKPVGPPRRNAVGLTGVAFSADGGTLAAGGEDGTVRIWDPAVRRPFPQRLPTSSSVARAAFASDGKTLATAELGGRVHLYDARSGKTLHSRRVGPTSRGLAFSPDARTLAVAAGPAVALLDSTSLAVRKKLAVPHSTGTCIGSPQLPFRVGCEVRDVAFSPRGDLLAVARADGRVDVWDPRTPRRLGGIQVHDAIVASVLFSDGRTVFSGAYDGTVGISNARTRQPLGQLPTRSPLRVAQMALTDDGTMLAIPGPTASIDLWNPRTRRLLGNLKASDEFSVASLAFTADGKTLATGAVDGVIRLWDVAARRPIGDTHRLDEGTRAVALSPDGRTLAAGRGVVSSRGELQIWHDLLWSSDEEVRERVCNLVVGRLSPAEWARLAPDIPYRSSCPR